MGRQEAAVTQLQSPSTAAKPLFIYHISKTLSFQVAFLNNIRLVCFGLVPFILVKAREDVNVRTKKPDNKEIEQYDHKGKERTNIPPVGLVTPDTDRDMGQKSYAYDPHLDPTLEFDSQRSAIENIIDNGLCAESLEDARAALSELQQRQEPYLDWTGKAEHTSFDVTTVSLHVHERIDPLTIIEAVRKKDDKPTVQVPTNVF